MKRLKVRHCRDNLVREDWRWEVWCTDTNDPHAQPLLVAYGSYGACVATARLLTGWGRMQQDRMHFAGFNCDIS